MSYEHMTPSCPLPIELSTHPKTCTLPIWLSINPPSRTLPIEVPVRATISYTTYQIIYRTISCTQPIALSSRPISRTLPIELSTHASISYITYRIIYTPTISHTTHWITVYPKKCAHGFVVLCFVVVKQSFIMNSHEVFIHIHQGCFDGTGAIVRLPQCQWSKPDGYGKISQCITTTKHSKAKTVCIFLGIYCIYTPTTSHHHIAHYLPTYTYATSSYAF